MGVIIFLLNFISMSFQNSPLGLGVLKASRLHLAGNAIPPSASDYLTQLILCRVANIFVCFTGFVAVCFFPFVAD
jgi:hypothetical protein